MRGRKKQPTHLKLVKDNPGNRALPKSEPKVKASKPTPPAHLSKDARAEWYRVVKSLHAMGCLSTLDRAALAAYCQAYGRWISAERALNEMAERDKMTGGLMIRTTNGNAVQNPLVGIANRAAADMVKYAAEFGMTPSSRTRISAEGDGGKNDPAESYF